MPPSLLTPTKTRRTRKLDVKAENLVSAFAETSLGLVLATVSQIGLCSVILGDDRNSMMQELQNRFPHAVTNSHSPVATTLDKSAREAADAIARVIEKPSELPQIPLDIRGTDFQRRVWQILRETPAGKPTTYGTIAARIRAPKASRAVGAACGANRLAIVIPCHRAIASTGKLTGYRWGLEWKRALLEREKR